VRGRPAHVALCLVLLALSGCGYHLLRYGAALGDVRRVAIQTFKNDSYEPGYELVVTDALIREFMRRGALQVVKDPKLADLVLAGRVLPIRTVGRSFSSVDLALEYEVQVKLDLQVKRRDGTAVQLDENALSDSELYTASADVEAMRKNREEALHRVAGVLAERVHEALFERLMP
jgi:hypothetical protein